MKIGKNAKEAKALSFNILTASAAGIAESKVFLPYFWDGMRNSPHLYHFAALPLLYLCAVYPPLKKFNIFSPREEGESRKRHYLKNGAKLFVHCTLWSSVFDMVSYLSGYGLKKVEWLKFIYPQLELFDKQLSQLPFINIYNSLLLTPFLGYAAYKSRHRIKSAFTNLYNADRKNL